MTESESSHNESQLYASLDKKVWKTMHSRYTASARLKNKHMYSQYSIAILSVYVLSLSIAPKFSLLCNLNLDSINFVSILLSICIIVVSLLEANNNYELKAERLYNCANELNTLLQKLKKVSDNPVDYCSEVESISLEYSKIRDKYSDNHSPHDYDFFRARYYSEFKDEISKSDRYWFYVKHYFMSYAFYIFLTVIPLIYFIYIVC